MHGLAMKDVNIVDIYHMIEVYLNTSSSSKVHASGCLTCCGSRWPRLSVG